MSSLLSTIRSQMDAEARKYSIWCPYCGAENPDEDYRHVTYHGSEFSPRSTSCRECEKDFLVTEIVERTYETSPSPAPLHTREAGS